jgi:hypothetical protein
MLHFAYAPMGLVMLQIHVPSSVPRHGPDGAGLCRVSAAFEVRPAGFLGLALRFGLH